MTHLTVLVQHSWAMQPAGAGPAPPPKAAAPETSSSRPKKPKIPRVRISIPSTVANFVYLFNLETHTSEMRAILDAQALDILTRLEDLALASCIRDPRRRDPLREQAVAQKAKAFGSKHAPKSKSMEDISAPRNNSLTASILTATRRYAAQARRSLLALATCRSRAVRSRSIGLLLEALDTNELGSDDGEVAALLLLVKELGDVLECSVTARRARLQAKQQQTIDFNELNANDIGPAGIVAVSDSIEAKSIPIDDFLEKIAICISLAVQRLEYACDVKSFFIPTEVQDSFHRLFNENLCYLQTKDPYIVQMITSAVETIHWLMTAKVESEELMATPVALSLLSQITRMAPNLEIVEMLEPFTGILNDLKEKQEWHLGCKFIKLLATATTANEQSCQLFISLIKKLDPDCWMWTFLAITCLGVTVLTTTSSSIRKLALEHGILSFIDKDPDPTTPTTSEDDTWRVRAAAATCLFEIFLHNRTDAMGALAHEALRARREVETHPHVRALLSVHAGAHHPRRVSFLYKYVCLSLAEAYAESQSRYSFLRKFLKSTNRRAVQAEPKKFGYLSRIGSEMRYHDAHVKLDRDAQRVDFDSRARKSKYVWNSRSLNLPDITQSNTRGRGDLEDEATRANEKVARSLDEASQLVLSVAPYHQNYKLVGLEEVEHESDDADTKPRLSLKPSTLSIHPYLTGHEIAGINIVNPANGTVNRRKLFDTAPRLK
ncbi:hypothetical protein BC830DRAFT_1106610 [Chytriomyces sp. MP71]|nr:hypothetical protein BC830DRAFT_1106610 [Chytriomyces sp. MP71]